MIGSKENRKRLIDYLKDHSFLMDPEQSETKDMHDLICRRVAENPSTIGIRERVLYAIPEVDIIAHNGNSLASVDIAFITCDDNYLVEVKVAKSSKLNSKANTQLGIAYEFFFRNFDIPFRKIAVHGPRLEWREIKRPIDDFLAVSNY